MVFDYLNAIDNWVFFVCLYFAWKKLEFMYAAIILYRKKRFCIEKSLDFMCTAIILYRKKTVLYRKKLEFYVCYHYTRLLTFEGICGSAC